MDEPVSRYVPVARVGDLGTARVLAARLEAAGIVVRVHSQALGPYPMTVGELALTELWIPEDRLDEAGTILLDADVNDALGSVDSERRTPLAELRLVAGILIVVIALAVLLRLMRVF